MKKQIVEDFGELGTFRYIPQWAQYAILAGAYQQGKAEALKYAFDEILKKVNAR